SITTDTDPGSPNFATATASGTIHFTGGLAPYLTEVMSLTGGTGLGNFSADTFNSVCPINSDPCNFQANGTVTLVPEPSTAGLFGIALAALAASRRRAKRLDS